jgi:hypothetical protein
LTQINRKEPELEPEPQFVISAPAPGGNNTDFEKKERTYLARRVSFSSLLKVLVMSVPIARAIFMK